jgi:hypothetical protein
MTIPIDAGSGPAEWRAAGGSWRTSPLPWLGIAGLFIAAVAMRHAVAANTDVSWLLIAGERWLAGQRLYSEILETNPPMAVLVYTPGILIGRALGVSAEAVVDALVLAAIAISLAISARILRGSSALAAGQRWLLALLAAAVLVILPVQAFGQREHIAVIGLLPTLAVLAQRMRRESPPAWAIAVAGLGLGLALSFKVHFAIAALCCTGMAAWHLKSWRLFVVPENFIAVAIIAGYGASIVLFFPEYFTAIAPLLRDVYTIGLPFALMLEKPVVPLWALALIGIALQRRGAAPDSTLALLIAASVGFGLVYFVQRKGWPYHSYPMMVFALICFGHAMTPGDDGAGRGRGRLAGALAAVAALFALSMAWFDHAFDARPLQAAVARFGPHPTILAIAGNAGVGHPLTRAVGGVWASRQQALLVASYDRYLRQTESPDRQTLATLEGYAAREREWLIADFRSYRPRIVLVDHLVDDWWQSWLRATPELVESLQGYRLSDTVMGVDIYVRRDD